MFAVQVIRELFCHATKLVQCQYISCSENDPSFFGFITSHRHLNIQHPYPMHVFLILCSPRNGDIQQ